MINNIDLRGRNNNNLNNRINIQRINNLQIFKNYNKSDFMNKIIEEERRINLRIEDNKKNEERKKRIETEINKQKILEEKSKQKTKKRKQEERIKRILQEKKRREQEEKEKKE